MNLTEIKIKFLDYLSEKGKLDDEKYSQLMNSQGSVFLFGAEFTNFIKDNYSALGIKSRDKVPASITEILEMVNEGGAEEEYDIPEEVQPVKTSSTEMTFNEADKSRNNIRSIYDKSGKLTSQEVSVYNEIGKLKSKYITGYNSAGEIDSEFQMEYGANIDERIGYSEQGAMGDCWLLSSLNSLSYTDAGKEIIKNAIKKNDDGTYTVNFKGVNTKVNITSEEIDAAKTSGKYSTKDDDMLLFELGFESVIKKIENGEIKIDGEHPGLTIKPGKHSKVALNGGNLEDAIFLLTGKDVKSEFKEAGSSTEEFDKILSSLMDNPDKYAAMIGFSAGESPLVLKDINGKEICTLEAGVSHAFSVKSVDKDGVTIVNPWDSSKEYKISLADARNLATGLQYIALDDTFTETDTHDFETIESPSSQTEEQAPITQEQPVTPSTPSGGGGDGGGGSVTPTPSTNPTGDNSTPTDNGPKSLDQMTEAELNQEKTTAETSLSTAKSDLSAATDGSDSDLQTAKTNLDGLYDAYHKALEDADKDMAEQLDKLVQDESTKEEDYDKAEVEVSEKEIAFAEAETVHKNAETKVTEYDSAVKALANVKTDDLSDSQKSDLATKKQAAQAAYNAAVAEEQQTKTAMETKEKELKEAQKDRDKKKEAFETAKQARIDYEAEITTAMKEEHPEIIELQKAYEDAKVQYDKDKAGKIDKAKEAITTASKRISEVDTALNNLEIKNKKSNEMTFNGDDFDPDLKSYNSEYVTEDGGMPYLYLGPEKLDPNKKYKVVVSLHGYGEFGNSERKLRESSLPSALLNGKLRNGTDISLDNADVIYLFPQSADKNHSWEKPEALQAVDDVISAAAKRFNINIDEDHISLTGHSMGGRGCLYFAEHYNNTPNLKHKINKVAALSAYNAANLENIKASGIPIRAYYGTSGDEGSASYTTGKFQKTFGSKNVFGVSVRGGHGFVPEYAYIIDQDGDGKSDLIQWLLSD